eukprot:SAG11_NODE_20215_length_450_cov_0.877493_1_plen_47_part_10
MRYQCVARVHPDACITDWCGLARISTFVSFVLASYCSNTPCNYMSIL